MKTLEFSDENNEHLHPFSQEQLKDVANYSRSFDGAAFISVVRIQNAESFANPVSIVLETAQEANSMALEVYKGNDKEVTSIDIPSGWIGPTNIPLTHLSRGESYYFQLRNKENVTAHISGGKIYYNG